MPFPADEERVARAERELGRRLPAQLRQRLIRENGGEITASPIRESERADFDPYWALHPVCEGADGHRATCRASHIVREATKAQAWPGFPDGAIPFASNGTGDRLIVFSSPTDFLYWNHEDGSTSPVRIWWD